MGIRRQLPALILALMILLTACGSKPAGSADTAKPAANSKAGGTLRVAYTTEPSSLAPWRSGDTITHFVYFALYESLVDQNEKMEIVPGLAEEWNPSQDGKTWTFKLRKGVKFHDGTDFNAEAVKFNVELWTTNPPKNAINTTKDITGVKVVDPYTVEIQLAQPSNQILISLSSKSWAMLSPAAVKAAGDEFGRKPVGTGPFKFDKWVTGSTITVVKNPDYWKKDAGGTQLPYLDKLEFKVIPDDGVRNTALLTGEIDVDTALPPQKVDDVLKDGKFEVFNQPGMGYTALRLLTSKPPFDKKEARQALAWAADREAINTAIYFGKAFAGYTMYSPPTPGFKKGATPYGPRNVAKAKELLAKAGYPSGFDMDLVVTSPGGQTMAELLQAQWKEIGVNVKIKMMERGAFLDGIVKRQLQSYIDGLTGRSDPHQYYSHLECGATYNGHDYCNKQLDQMDKDGVIQYASLSDPKRLELYSKAEDIVLEDMPMIPLIHPPLLFAWSKSVNGIVATPPGRVFWTQVTKTKG